MEEVHISLYGTGAETCHVAVSKEAYEWWQEQDSEMLEQYVLAWGEDEYDFTVPEFADFTQGHAIYDAPGVVDHYWRIGYDDARIEVEVDGESIFDDDYVMLNEVANGMSFEDDPDETDIRTETTWTDDEKKILKTLQEKKYIITYEGVDKGSFFDATFDVEEFDKSNITFFTAEDWYTGEDKVSDVTYRGVELDDMGGDTTGKGTWVYLWTYGE